jgi:transcriptional regulator with XRE-family HTH domain
MESLQKNNLTIEFPGGKCAGMDDLEFLGRLKRAITESPYTQAQLAKLVGTTHGHFSQMLSGLKPMYLDRLLKIMDLIDFDASFIIPEHHRKSEKVEFDMSDAKNPDLIRQIFEKLVRMDSEMGVTGLARIDAYAEGLLATTAAGRKKKRA